MLESQQTTLRIAVRRAIERGWYRNQGDLARRLDISEAQMSRFINGLRVPKDLRERIARGVGFPVEALWPDDHNRDHNQNPKRKDG